MLIAWQQPVRRRVSLTAICLGALAAAACSALVVALIIAPRAPSRPDIAQVIAAGETRANAVSSGADDLDLADDEAAAGAMWAKANHPKTAAACPVYSTAFYQGCADTVGVARK